MVNIWKHRISGLLQILVAFLKRFFESYCTACVAVLAKLPLWPGGYKKVLFTSSVSDEGL